MKLINYRSSLDTQSYNKLLDDLYAHVTENVEEVSLEPIKIIAVDGNEPPGGAQYQSAISCLYGVGYTLKMGLKFKKLPRPKGYFDYKVGGLGSLWWSTSGQSFDIANPDTLRWKAYLIVPPFVDNTLFELAVEQAKAKNPKIPYEKVEFETLKEGHAVQVLHIGPYDKEISTVDRMYQFMSAHHLAAKGKHNEIYISDPRRTKPDKLKTVIRLPVETQ